MTTASALRKDLFAIEFPSDWRVEEYDGAEAVIVSPAPEGSFRANVVVTVVDSDAPIEQASLAALAAAREQHPGALIIGCDLWNQQDLPARLVTFTYPTGEADQVDVLKWVWATGRRHIHLSASAAPYQSPGLAETFRWIASRMRIEGHA